MFENANMVILKVTKGCNLRCKYCYVRHKELYDGVFIDFDVYKHIIDQIIIDKKKVITFKRKNSPESLLHCPENIEIIFHGGEPTTIGAEYLNKLCSYAVHKANEMGVVVKFGMQTNATLLSDKMCRVLKEYNISVGLSFDGAIEGSNTQRTMKDVSFYRDVTEKLRNKGISHGTLMVVNQSNADYFMENVNYMVNNLHIDSTKANYVEDTNNLGDSEITGEEFFEKVSKKYLTAFMNGETNFTEGNSLFALQSYLNTLITGNVDQTSNAMGNCYIKFCGAGCHIIELEPNGNISRCGRYAEEDDTSILTPYGEKDFLSMNAQSKILHNLKIKHELTNEIHCDECIAKTICDYGCLAFYYAKFGKYGMRTDLVCPLHIKLMNFIIDNEVPLMRAYIKHLAKNTTSGTKAHISVYGKEKNRVSMAFKILMNKLGYTYREDFSQEGYLCNVDIDTENRKQNN